MEERTEKDTNNLIVAIKQSEGAISLKEDIVDEINARSRRYQTIKAKKSLPISSG